MHTSQIVWLVSTLINCYILEPIGCLSEISAFLSIQIKTI